jgi:hypothetical protein
VKRAAVVRRLGSFGHCGNRLRVLPLERCDVAAEISDRRSRRPRACALSPPPLLSLEKHATCGGYANRSATQNP